MVDPITGSTKFYVDMDFSQMKDLAAKLLASGGNVVEFEIGGKLYQFCGSSTPTIKFHRSYAMIVADLFGEKSMRLERVENDDGRVAIVILN